MSEIVTERSESILSIQFNRPEKKNALTMSMYDTVAELLNAAARDDGIRVVLLHGAGDSFSAGNDLGDFLKNPPKGYDSPQGRFIDALNNSISRLSRLYTAPLSARGPTLLRTAASVYPHPPPPSHTPFPLLSLVPHL